MKGIFNWKFISLLSTFSFFLFVCVSLLSLLLSVFLYGKWNFKFNFCLQLIAIRFLQSNIGRESSEKALFSVTLTSSVTFTEIPNDPVNSCIDDITMSERQNEISSSVDNFISFAESLAIHVCACMSIRLKIAGNPRFNWKPFAP